MPKFEKSRDELQEELIGQIKALRSSAEGYDRGDIWEAKRLASSLYILLHDETGRTKSLLGMLGLKKSKFLSSMHVSKTPFGGTLVMGDATPLLMIQISNEGGQYIPVLGDSPRSSQDRWISFNEWYEECIFNEISKITLSRKNMIFTARTQDGGGHVDSHITDPQYREFTISGDPFVRIINNGTQMGMGMGMGIEGKPLKGGVWAIIRQLTWEVDQSLKLIGL